MISRLLFFEGPPGGGKSSLSQYVAQQLQAACIAGDWIEEHTLDSTFEAFFDALETAPAEAISTLLAGWHQLIEPLRTSSTICCLDGAFFHSTLKLLLAYDYDQVQITQYVQTLYNLFTPFTPRLIHLTGDADHIMQATIAERGLTWATNVANDVAQYPCQQRLGLSGIEGMIEFFIESQRQFEAIAATFPFASHRLDTTARAWDQYEQIVCAWLDIPFTTEQRTPSCDIAQYTGTYQTPANFPPAFNHPFEVEQTPDGLRLHMVFMRNFRLIEHTPDCFAIAGRPLQLEFVRDAEGNIQGVIYPFVPEQRFFCEKTL